MPTKKELFEKVSNLLNRVRGEVWSQSEIGKRIRLVLNEVEVSGPNKTTYLRIIECLELMKSYLTPDSPIGRELRETIEEAKALEV